MAKFSRFLFGGVVGAGLALLFAPKPGRELRRMLMGGGRKALPAPEEEYTAPSDFGPAEPVSPEATIDLESKLAETREQVEAQLEESIAPTVASEGEPAVEAEIVEVETEAPAEVPVEAEAVAEEAAEAVTPAEEALAEEAPVEARVEEAPAEEAEAVAEEAAAEEPQAAAEEPEAEPEEGWEALKTPAEGEPALEAELTVSEEVEAKVPPAPAGIDREEMRRRIDETRARLKAKAFDAMVSGETFLDETSAEKAEHHAESETPGIDEEIGEQIDEKLREQD